MRRKTLKVRRRRNESITQIEVKQKNCTCLDVRPFQECTDCTISMHGGCGRSIDNIAWIT